MALQRRPAQMIRRVTLSALAVDVGAFIFIGAVTTFTIGFIVFLIGLAITAFVYYNFRQAMKTRGMF